MFVVIGSYSDGGGGIFMVLCVFIRVEVIGFFIY